MMLNTLVVSSKKQMPQWRHLMRGLAAVLLLSGLGSPAMAESVSVTSTFVPPAPVSTPGCDDGTGAAEMVIVPGVGSFRTNCQSGSLSAAYSYCSGLGGGYTLASESQARSLYNAYPNNQMNTVWGWPTGTSPTRVYYWTTTYSDPNSNIIYDFAYDSTFDGPDGGGDAWPSYGTAPVCIGPA